LRGSKAAAAAATTRAAAAASHPFPPFAMFHSHPNPQHGALPARAASRAAIAAEDYNLDAGHSSSSSSSCEGKGEQQQQQRPANQEAGSSGAGTIAQHNRVLAAAQRLR